MVECREFIKQQTKFYYRKPIFYHIFRYLFLIFKTMNMIMLPTLPRNPYLLSYAKILYSNKKMEDALKYAKKALDLYVKKNIPTEEIDDLIERIQSM